MVASRFRHYLKIVASRYLSRITRTEYRILLIVLFMAASAWVFIELADEVVEGETKAVDELILLSLRNGEDPSDPLGPPWFEEAMRDFTALGSVAVLSLLCTAATGFLLLQNKKRMAIFMVVAVSGGLAISSALKLGFNRPRPDLVPHEAYVMSASFPSGHSMLSAVVYLTLGGLLARYAGNGKLKLYILTLSILATLLVGCSRVYLGVHWPSDVFAGWTAGATWALFCWLIALVLQRLGKVEDHFEV